MWFLSLIEFPTIIISSIAAFATIGAAIAAFLAANHTKKATQAQLINSLLEEYSSKEMVKKMRILINWKDKYCDKNDPNKFIDVFKEMFSDSIKSKNNSFRKVDLSRRQLSHYYYRIKSMQEINLFDDKIFNIVLPDDLLSVCKNIAVPLSKAIKDKMH